MYHFVRTFSLQITSFLYCIKINKDTELIKIGPKLRPYLMLIHRKLSQSLIAPLNTLFLNFDHLNKNLNITNMLIRNACRNNLSVKNP